MVVYLMLKYFAMLQNLTAEIEVFIFILGGKCFMNWDKRKDIYLCCLWFLMKETIFYFSEYCMGSVLVQTAWLEKQTSDSPVILEVLPFKNVWMLTLL